MKVLSSQIKIQLPKKALEFKIALIARIIRKVITVSIILQFSVNLMPRKKTIIMKFPMNKDMISF